MNKHNIKRIGCGCLAMAIFAVGFGVAAMIIVRGIASLIIQ